ncbi:MAG: TonB family protein, partial [Deltaproteobacteria bacterium]|nr:TonB family protein [Deltaproteobacteria bacterium]
VDKPRLGILIPAAGLSLVINMLLFSLLPSFGQKAPQRADLESIIPVTLIRFERQEPPPHAEEKKERVKQEEPEKKIPVVKLRFTQKAIPRKLRAQLDMPRLAFKINPMLKIGMEISPPPPPPKEPLYHRPGIPSTFSGISLPAPAPPGEDTVRRGHSGPYLEGELDQVPVVIFRKKPFYPFRARARNISGDVRVKFLVDKDGHVNSVHILKSVPPGVFDKNVIKALSCWRFLPGKIHGRPVPTWVITTIKFRLEG